jgi:hypothetical protein
MSPRPVPEYDEQSWLMKALREAAHELGSQLWGLDEDDLRWRPDEDAMSLKEIAAHLRDCEEYLLESLQQISYHDEPCLGRFDGDVLVLERDYRDVDLAYTVEGFESLRGRTTMLLWSLASPDWDRTGVHPYRGPVSLLQLVREQNQHDLEHLWEARQLRERLAGRTEAR